MEGDASTFGLSPAVALVSLPASSSSIGGGGGGGTSSAGGAATHLSTNRSHAGACSRRRRVRRREVSALEVAQTHIDRIARVEPAVQALLALEGVPFFPLTERTLGQIYGSETFVLAGLRVPSEFYYEILWLLRRTQDEVKVARAARDRDLWPCGHCGEDNPAHFEVCWNCERPRHAVDPACQSPTT